VIYDFGGGMTCIQCREVTDFVPVSFAVQIGAWPADAEMTPASDIPVTDRVKNVYWAQEDTWPTVCVFCDPWGWVIREFPPGASFFRS
jgi:hypothetical protein